MTILNFIFTKQSTTRAPLIALLLSSIIWIGCSDDVAETMLESNNFTVTIENVSTAYDFFDSGTTGFIEPGQNEMYTFHAGKGHYLQFATMMVQSNDLFFAPDDTGIPLFDENGEPLSGDISSMISLWDAGTEVNEEPGSGPNQAPRQSGPDTGTDESGNVILVTDANDGYIYPETSEVLKVNLLYDGNSMFTLTIENISGSSSLPTPLAPGTWVVHSGNQNPMFVVGSPASIGLERMAEDGDNAMMNTNLTSKSGFVTPFAPGAYSIGNDNGIFTEGQVSSASLEALAEDGNPAGFSMVFNTPDNGSGPAPIFPGEIYSITFTAEEGQNFSLATMLVQSNDWIVGLDNISLFNNGSPLSGDITASLKLYDSGTEEDEYPGAGNFQAPRQSGANNGPAENGTVEEESLLFDNVPLISDMIRITIDPS